MSEADRIAEAWQRHGRSQDWQGDTLCVSWPTGAPVPPVQATIRQSIRQIVFERTPVYYGRKQFGWIVFGPWAKP